MRCQLAASAVAASWRLGRWELLDQYLTVAEGAGPELLDSSERWEVRLGHLMGAVARKDPVAVDEQVRHMHLSLRETAEITPKAEAPGACKVRIITLFT